MAQSVLQDLASSVRTAVWCIYGIAGFLWLIAIAFAGYRVYQMRVLAAVDAEVLGAETDSYTSAVRETDSDGFSRESQMTIHVPVVRVRYVFRGKTYTADARHDTGSSFKSLEERIARGWKRGGRIRVHLDPAKPEKPIPDLGVNAHTFQVSIAFLFGGAVFALFGYLFGRFGTYAFRLFEHMKQTHAG